MASPQFDEAGLLLRALRRADMENSDFIGEAEGAEFIEAAWRELYLKVVGEYEDSCVYGGPNPTTVSPATSSVVEMPSNFLKLKALLLEDSAGRGIHFLRPVTHFRELEPLIINATFTGRSGVPTHYWFNGAPDGAPARARVYPFPDREYTVQTFYVPNLSLADVTGGDGLRWLAGWDEFVVVSGAMKMKDKEESDCTVLLAEKTGLWDAMKRQITPLDHSEPTHVISMSQPRNYPSFYSDPDSENF